jgi:hypothetical protein
MKSVGECQFHGQVGSPGGVDVRLPSEGEGSRTSLEGAPQEKRRDGNANVLLEGYSGGNLAVVGAY